LKQLLNTVHERLRDQGGRMTPQRRIILQILEKQVDHPTAEELFEMVRETNSNVNLSTIYRTLRWLEEEELVDAREFREERHQMRFDPALSGEHHHFVCEVCKTVTEFTDTEIDQIAQRFEQNNEVVVKRVVLTLYGLCSNCQKAVN
jgi:Fur family ferric uptake transcriptional regulator